MALYPISPRLGRSSAEDPIGAFGGRADVMAQFDPRRPGYAAHSGTFNGNAVTMAAGIASLELLTLEVIARINALGGRLRRGMSAALADAGVTATVLGIGSLAHVHLGIDEVREYRASACARSFGGWHWLRLALVNRGVFVPPRALFPLSTPMTEAHVDETLGAFREAVGEVRPILAANNVTAAV